LELGQGGDVADELKGGMNAISVLDTLDIPRHLYVGTASWNYPSWEGLIYPENAPEDRVKYLESYSRYYNMVEVDQYFWSLFPPEFARMPDREEVAAYANAVPDEFRFTVKAPNSLTLTHFYKQQSTKYRKYAGELNPYGFLNPDLWEQFRWALEPAADKLAAVILQFSYLNKSMMSGVREFLELLDGFLEKTRPDIPIAVESRNPNYLNRKYFTFLKERNIPHVYLSGYYMPSPIDIYRKFGNTGAFSLFRLHGGDRKDIEERTGSQWIEVVADRGEELLEIADIAAEEIRLERDFYLSINNHYEGSSPISIQRFLQRWPQ